VTQIRFRFASEPSAVKTFETSAAVLPEVPESLTIAGKSSSTPVTLPAGMVSMIGSFAHPGSRPACIS